MNREAGASAFAGALPLARGFPDMAAFVPAHARLRASARMAALAGMTAFAGALVIAAVPSRAAPAEQFAGAARKAGVDLQASRPLPGDPAGKGAALAVSDERRRAALERGLEWLCTAQAVESDGSFPALGLRAREPLSASLSPASDGAGQFAPVAVCALGALALMAGGSAPERGPHGREVARAIDWIVAHTDLDPQSEHRGYVSRAGDALSRMHGQGFATLALAQAYTISPKSPRGEKLLEALTAAVGCIEHAQGVDGGWYYEPKPGLAHENSITITAVQALRAAHAAGVRVDPVVIARALEYVKRTQKPDGSFRYALGDDRGPLAITAAAIATLESGGTYAGKPLDDGYDWIARKLAARGARADMPAEDEVEVVRCPFYERIYLAQALWQGSDRRAFDAWWSDAVRRAITVQEDDGAWRDPRYGDAYATAMTCLLLALPEGLLPIFQR